MNFCKAAHVPAHDEISTRAGRYPGRRASIVCSLATQHDILCSTRAMAAENLHNAGPCWLLCACFRNAECSRVCWFCARTCSGWEDVLTNISPYTFGYMGVALALGLCVIGAAWYAAVPFVNHARPCAFICV